MPEPGVPEEGTLLLEHGNPVAGRLALAIQTGDLDGLRRLLAERPELATVRMIGRLGVEGGWRTPLHAATDWPGYFPAAPATVAFLLGAGADPNDDCGGDRPETPLHWAASTDDEDVAVVLSKGADLNWIPEYARGTALEAAGGSDTRRMNVVAWLRELGAQPSSANEEGGGA